MSFGTGLLYDILSDIMRSIVDHIGFLISDIYSYAVEINISTAYEYISDIKKILIINFQLI